MAIKLTANYAKKLGLPGYSSHQFNVSVETELTDLGQVQGESTRLYGLLQDAVDREMQNTGFVPEDTYGMEANGSNGSASLPPQSANGNWRCSDKQKELILKLVDENDLDKNAVEDLAIKRFDKGVRELNRLQASGLIEELLENSNGKKAVGKANGRSNGRRAYAGKGGGR